MCPHKWSRQTQRKWNISQNGCSHSQQRKFASSWSSSNTYPPFCLKSLNTCRFWQGWPWKTVTKPFWVGKESINWHLTPSKRQLSAENGLQLTLHWCQDTAFCNDGCQWLPICGHTILWENLGDGVSSCVWFYDLQRCRAELSSTRKGDAGNHLCITEMVFGPHWSAFHGIYWP